MGSLRPSRSNAEIRQGSFSPCLVVGRPKSRKSRLVCFSRAAGLSARLGATSRRCGRLVPDHKTIADCRKENGGSASAFAPARTRWLGNDKVVIATKVGLEWRAGTYFAIPAARESFGKSRIPCAGFGLITRYLSGSLARSTCSDRRNCRGNANAVQARMDPCRWRQ